MGWLANLRGKKVALDTAPLIYFVEENSTYLPLVRLFFENMDNGLFTCITSTVTLIEVLVYPLRQGNQSLARRYRDILLTARNLETIPLSPEIAEKAAALRAAYNLRTPDAIQTATALCSQATVLLTNDLKLSVIPDLEILILDHLKKS